MIVYFQKFNAEEDVFWQPWSKHLDENPEVKGELKISAVVCCNGEDGQTEMPNAPGSEHGWRQLLCVIGEDANTPVREEVAKKIASNFNDFAAHHNFCYPHHTRIGRDLTEAPERAVDLALLDKEVIGLVLAAYPSTPLEELKEFEEITGAFCSNMEHGAQALDAMTTVAPEPVNNVQN